MKILTGLILDGKLIIPEYAVGMFIKLDNGKSMYESIYEFVENLSQEFVGRRVRITVEILPSDEEYAEMRNDAIFDEEYD